MYLRTRCVASWSHPPFHRRCSTRRGSNPGSPSSGSAEGLRNATLGRSSLRNQIVMDRVDARSAEGRPTSRPRRTRAGTRFDRQGPRAMSSSVGPKCGCAERRATTVPRCFTGRTWSGAPASKVAPWSNATARFRNVTLGRTSRPSGWRWKCEVRECQLRHLIEYHIIGDAPRPRHQRGRRCSAKPVWSVGGIARTSVGPPIHPAAVGTARA